jgi:heme exporter protein A
MQGCRLIAAGLACRRGDNVLFAGLDCTLDPGDALLVTGPNGAGKSTLLRALAGMLPPFTGSVDRRGALAFMGEHLALEPDWPLARAMRFWHALDGCASHDWAMWHEKLGIAHLADVPVRYLSTGQRKRAAIAIVGASRAPIWLLDEPLNALDRDAVATLERMIAQHRAGGGIVAVASHQGIALEKAQQIALHRPTMDEVM